jgi:hypothetical protein
MSVTAEMEIQRLPHPLAGDFNAPFFAALQEINERLLDAMARIARDDAIPAFPSSVPLRELLVKSTKELRRRAASRKILLVEMGFRDQDWWRSILREPRPSLESGSLSNPFRHRESVALARSTLMLAWRAVKTDPHLSRGVLGMVPEVTQFIGQAALGDLDRIADHHCRRMQPRWLNRPWFWCALLEAAGTDSTQALLAVDLQALQLIADDLAPLQLISRA